jgi:hypothetical protein
MVKWGVKLERSDLVEEFFFDLLVNESSRETVSAGRWSSNWLEFKL